MQDYFPRGLFYKEKTGWSLPSAQWLNESTGSLRRDIKNLWPQKGEEISVDKAFALPAYAKFRTRFLVKGVPTKSLFAMSRIRKWAKDNNMVLY